MSSGYDRFVHQRPDVLLFQGKTDTEGKLHIYFKYKNAFYGKNFEIAVDKFSIDARNMYNVLQEWIIFTDQNDVENRVDLPPSKVSTFGQLCTLLLSTQQFVGEPNEHFFDMDLDFGKLDISVIFARALGILNKDNKISLLISKLNSARATITKEANDRVIIDCSNGNGEMFLLPGEWSRNIWMQVSDDSFQAIFIYTDIVEKEFISGERVPNLGIFGFENEKEIINFATKAPQWKRTNTLNVSRCFIQIADSRGRTFAGVSATIQCVVKRRNLK